MQKHSQAFESLLALTPAREYYGSHFIDGQDPSEQWNRKKQSKEQKKAARKAKLDPENNKSALDVIKRREAAALKRKRDADGEVPGVGQVKTEGHDAKPAKRRKGDSAEDEEERQRRKAEQKKEKRRLRKEKKAVKQAKAEAEKARKQEAGVNESRAAKSSTAANEADDDSQADAEEMPIDRLAELQNTTLDFSGLEDPEDGQREVASHISSAPTTPITDSPAFDLGTNHSTASSSSSLDPPPTNEQEELKQKQPLKLNIPSAEPASTSTLPQSQTDGISSPKPRIPKLTSPEKQERLRARIEELRAARKADDKPARSRQELLEQRRKKDEQRKANKKEQRRKAKEEEARRQDEQLRGSGSPLNGDIFSPRSSLPPPQTDNSYSFSRLAFEDGTSADASLSQLKDPSKRKGPQDPKTALQAAQSKDARLAGYDADKRSSIEEKDRWISARKRAGGEKVRDDSSLLKKALKRREKDKNKSEKFWKEKEEGVVKGREMKQKRRETNLAKRREEKGGKGKKSGPKKGGKKKRAGFEGRFKA